MRKAASAAIEWAALEAMDRFTRGRLVRLLGVRAEFEWAESAGPAAYPVLDHMAESITWSGTHG